MNFEFFRPDCCAVKAVLLREFRAAFINRYFQTFAALSLLGGIASAIFAEDRDAIGFFIMQISLYLVSLLALLAGVSSAQAEQTEWQIMFAQPVSRSTFVLAKFVAYVSIFAGVLLLLFVPGILAGSAPRQTITLYFQTLLLAAAFLTLGLTCGFFAHDRAKALIAAVTGWLVLLFGIDLVALFAARWSAIQGIPDLWIGLLMLNPLDAFRVHALFALEQIPAEAANKTALANWWIAHAGMWCAIIAAAWSVFLSVLATLRLNRWED
jgi:ABC-2 type transport system permease protein/Cu-processing system permease protein